MFGIEFNKQTKVYLNPNLPIKGLQICTAVRTKFNFLLGHE
jgi:hypothetical protein